MNHETRIIGNFNGKKEARDFETKTIKDIRSQDPKALPLNKGEH
jgi:hypothetical protein